MEKKTVVYLKNWNAFESHYWIDKVLNLYKSKKPIKWFVDNRNDKTNTFDKYICDFYIVWEISHIIDLEWECIYNSEEDLILNVNTNNKTEVDNWEVIETDEEIKS